MDKNRVEKLSFVKMQGDGNDYIYMDTVVDENFRKFPESEYPVLARKISDRHFGIGSDGLILILPASDADFFMRIFNADGSEAQMCGNGIRCVAKYVYERSLTDKSRLKINTKAGIKDIELNTDHGKVDSITVDMGSPLLEPEAIPVSVPKKEKFVEGEISVDGNTFRFTAVGMGNPHCVIFTDKLTDELIYRYGPEIEKSNIFPERTNVEFIKVINRTTIEMRVWERGSGETLACGTGACASAVASFLNGFTEPKVEVRLLGGSLFIDYDQNSGHVFMTGPAEFVAEGTYFYH